MGRIEKIKRQLIEEANIRLLNEQPQDYLISTAGYNAIEKMEDERGCVDTDLTPCENVGCNYDPHSKDDIIRKHIKDTIGLKTWFTIPDNFRVQIFDMMFNTDSKQKDRYVWLGGLADALGFSGSRGDIMGDATTRAAAIKFIQQTTTGEFDSAYNEYKNRVRDEQYKSIATNTARVEFCTYTINWKYRPCQVERYYNGDNSLCNDLLKTAKEKKTESTNKKKITITHNGNVEELKAGLKKLWEDGHTGVYTELGESPGKIIIEVDPSQQTPHSMSYLYSNKNQGEDTLEKVYKTVEAANPNDPIISRYRYDMNPVYDNKGKLIKGFEGYIVWFDRSKE